MMTFYNKYFFLLIIFIFIGCTHNVRLSDRISYESEKLSRTKNIENANLKIIGDSENENMFLTRKPTGFIGSANSNTMNIGETFNLYLEQLSTSSGMTCSMNCTVVKVKLNETDVSYAFAFNDSGYDYGYFSANLTYSITNPLGKSLYVSRKYEYKREMGSTEIAGNVSFYPIVNAIEQVVMQLLFDISKSVKNL